MIGVADNKDLIALLPQLLDYVLGSLDQDTSSVDNFESSAFGLEEYAGRLTVGANEHGSPVGDIVQGVGYGEPLLV